MNKMEKKILYLTLKKRWFDQIAKGIKKEEYREIKPYWEKRFTSPSSCYYKDYDEIHFRNGYSKKSPFMRVKAGIIFQANRVFDGEEKFVFVIKLKEIIELHNYS